MRARRSLNLGRLGNPLGDLGGLTMLDGALSCARLSSARSRQFVDRVYAAREF